MYVKGIFEEDVEVLRALYCLENVNIKAQQDIEDLSNAMKNEKKRVNAQSREPRTVEEVKKKLSDLKSCVKKRERERHQLSKQTGGGPAPKLLEWEEKGKGAKTLRKKEKRKQRKAEQEKNIVIEDSELLSKEQLKKLSKQPLNSIRVSGKRKRKMLKRLRHAQKEKSQMEVEEASGSHSGSKGPKVKVTDDMDTDEEMSDVNEVEDSELT